MACGKCPRYIPADARATIAAGLWHTSPPGYVFLISFMTFLWGTCWNCPRHDFAVFLLRVCTTDLASIILFVHHDYYYHGCTALLSLVSLLSSSSHHLFCRFTVIHTPATRSPLPISHATPERCFAIHARAWSLDRVAHGPDHPSHFRFPLFPFTMI